MTHYPNPDRALRQLRRHGRTPAAVPLREMRPSDLVHVATTHPRGPQPEHLAEADRRVREASPLTARVLAVTFMRLRTHTAVKQALAEFAQAVARPEEARR